MTDEEWRSRFDARLRAVEERLTHIEKTYAVAEVHRDNVERRLSSIETTLRQLVWLIVFALVGGLVNFALSGGFALVSP